MLSKLCKHDALAKLRQSKVHGQGVFAMHHIPIHTKICYYDGYDMQKSSLYNNIYVLDINASSNMCRIGYDVPRSSIGIAQFINDGAKPNFPHKDKSYINNDMHEYNYAVTDCLRTYLSQSLRKQNVNFNGEEEFWCYSTRDISAGEELFFSYGIKYWLNSIIKKCKNPTFCLLYAYYIDENNIETIENIMKYLNICEDSQQWLDYGISNTAPLPIKIVHVLKALSIPVPQNILKKMDRLLKNNNYKI